MYWCLCGSDMMKTRRLEGGKDWRKKLEREQIKELKKNKEKEKKAKKKDRKQMKIAKDNKNAATISFEALFSTNSPIFFLPLSHEAPKHELDLIFTRKMILAT